MIFQKEHVELILKGEKTQTRRVNRGHYQIGRDYAIQPCRTCKGIEGHRIKIVGIEDERGGYPGAQCPIVSHADALAEGFTDSLIFEEMFIKINPEWDGLSRWVFKFKLIKIGRED